MIGLSAHREEKGVARPLSRVVIVGGAGEVGRLVARVVGPAVGLLEVVDLETEPEDGLPQCTYSRSDVMQWVNGDDNLLRDADCVVLAVPEDVALRALEPLAERMPAGALLVDTLSVKGSIVSRLRRLPGRFEKLSLNPMFAPMLDVRDQPILAVEVSPGVRSGHFLNLFRAAGSQVISCDAEEHDRATAALQALTHAAILSFGIALAEHGEDLGRLLRVAPPPFVAMTALLARIVSGSAMTYLDIQASNDFAQRARDLLAEGGRRLDSAVDGGPSGFSDLLASLGELLGSEASELEKQAQRLLEAVPRESLTGSRANGNAGQVTG